MLDYCPTNRVPASKYIIPSTRMMTFVCCVILVNLVARVVSAKTESLPRIVMVEIPGITPNDETLYEAIRAQLSATSVRLDRLTVDDSQFDFSDSLNSASTLAAEHDAALLFWIMNNGSISTIFYYKRESSNPKIRTRTLDLASESLPSRSDTIGNAVSSIVEETVSIRRNTSIRSTPEPPAPPPPLRSSERGRKRIDFFAVYAGSYFARRLVTHGVGVGLGVLPTEWIVLTMSYVQGFPLTSETERYRLALRPRNIELAIAGILPLGFLTLRLGLAWSVDIRSYTMTSSSASISPRRGRVNEIYSLVPFLTATWPLSDVIGIVTGLGADFSLNEKAYKILRDDDTESVVLEPFRTKLIYKVGLVVQL